MRDIQRLIDKAKGFQIGDEAYTLPDQTAPIGFSCPICGKVYETEAEAIECRDQPYDNDGLSVGDIVIVPGKWNNNGDLNDPWIAFEISSVGDAESHFDHAGYKIAFFVVTAIHDESTPKHRCIVTLASLANGSLRVGWNPANGDGHYTLFKTDGVRRAYQNMYWPNRMGELLYQCVIPDQVREEAATLAALGIISRNLL